METDLPKNFFIRALAARHRVLLLGGMAVIAYGKARLTKDFDIWMEPFESPEEWTSRLVGVLADFPEAYFWSLAQQRIATAEEVSSDIADFGVIRIGGFELPVDVFRRPNELQPEDFEAVWSRAAKREDGVRLPAELDLIVTKMNTGRQHDDEDSGFLLSLVKRRFREQLSVCDLTEAKILLARFTDPEVLSYALGNPNADVRNYALELLREFEAEGDPFSRDILAAWKEPT